VKRAPSSYICFCTAKRQEIKDANPDATFGQLGKILGEIWGQLDAKGKEVNYSIFILEDENCLSV
jgi:hypothetical protein